MMAKVRRKRSNTPRHKRMKRAFRLQAASHWIPKYEGKNLIRSYSKYFAVDSLCAIKELQMLGVEIPAERITQVQATVLQKQRQRARKKEREKQREREKEMSRYGQLFGYDEYFAFIAGFTAGGASYGVTWDEWNSIKIDDAHTASDSDTYISGDDVFDFDDAMDCTVVDFHSVHQIPK